MLLDYKERGLGIPFEKVEEMATLATGPGVFLFEAYTQQTQTRE